MPMDGEQINPEDDHSGQGRKPKSWGWLPVRERYGLVLALILIGYLLAGFYDGPIATAINAVIWTALLLTTLSAPDLPERLRQAGLAATAVVLVTAVSLAMVASDVASGLRLLILASAQLASMLAILFRILRHSSVTLQTVMGGIAAYALIAFVMASVYHGADLLFEDTFLNGAVASGDYIYFSFVTLTTLGYGDINPASDLAKRLVVVEAFVGQVFLITLVARLVSLWGGPNVHDRKGAVRG